MQTVSISPYDIKMRIITSRSVITQTEKILPLTVEIRNNSNNEITILDFADFSTDSLSVFQFLINKNGRRKISPVGLLKKRRIPRASDYKKIKSGGTLSFEFNLDLSLLVDDEKHFGEENNDFGTYTIEVIFKDRFLIKKNAIKQLKSNQIEIVYRQ